MDADAATATVLVVDDDQGVWRLIQKALKRKGLNVVRANSGNQAIAWLTANHADLMLLDLKLQDLQGKEVISHLVDINRSVPFIVITGQGDERVAVEMMKRGALDYLVKDAGFLKLVAEVVRRTLNQLQNQKRLAAAEAGLRESEARFRLTADQAPVLIWMSGTDKLCTWFNRPWLEFTGRSMQQELGDGWTQGVHSKDLSHCLETYAASFEARKPFSMEYRLRRHDGEWRWIFDSGFPLHDANGNFTGYIGSCIDITERRSLERQVVEISEREQRRIGQDLHDGLGQQLTAIGLTCESLRSDLASACPQFESQAADICQFIRDAIAQTRVLAHGLAAFTVETGGLQRALTELAQATSSLGGLKCHFECSSPVTVQDGATAAHLYRMAQEAVNNAIKHSQASEVRIRLHERSGVLRLEIRDNGKGLPWSKKPDFGMGLRLMQHRAGVIGGEVEVRSRTGRGVAVICTLRRRQ